MPAQVIFRLADQYYSIGIDFVSEIVPIVASNKVPNMPEDWHGVANIRGIITPIIDLRRRVGLEAIEPELSAPLIILKRATRQLALLVDEVEQVLHNPTDSSAIRLEGGQLTIALEAEQFFENTPMIAG